MPPSRRLGKKPEWLARIDFSKIADAKQRVGLLLAWRASRVENEGVILHCLMGADPEARLLAAKWIADDKLSRYRDRIVARAG